jgi:hypothetical protein
LEGNNDWTELAQSETADKETGSAVAVNNMQNQ